MNVGKISSDDAKRAGRRRVDRRAAEEREEPHAERDNSVICRITRTAADERLLRVAQAAAGEQPLDDQLVGAVGSHRQDGAANDAGPQGVGSGEIEI